MRDRPPGSYGIDAPRLLVVPAVLVVAGSVLVVAGSVQVVLTREPWPLFGVVLIAACCQRHLTARALTGVTRRNLGWRQWRSGPWLPTHLVTARKPTPSFE